MIPRSLPPVPLPPKTVRVAILPDIDDQQRQKQDAQATLFTEFK